MNRTKMRHAIITNRIALQLVRAAIVLVSHCLAAGAAIAQTSNFTGLWWNPTESGWGLNVNHQGTTLFATLFTYDSSRQPMWLVMSNGSVQADDPRSFSGDLFQTTGSPYNAATFTPLGEGNISKVGTMSLTFESATSAVLTYSTGGVVVRKAIQPQVFGSGASVCRPVQGSRTSLTNYQDLWWNPAEAGWGLNLTHQDDTLFGTLFTYDATGRGMWLVMSDGRRQADGSYMGDLYRTKGSPFNAQPFTPLAPSDVSKAGSMALRFADGENGRLSYTVDDTTVTKNIRRQEFGASLPSCVPAAVAAARASLCELDTGFFGSTCRPVTVPYSTSGAIQATIIGSSQLVVAAYRITAVDGPLTLVASVTDANNVVSPFVSGLQNGQVLAAGATREFSLISPLTGGRTANLQLRVTANDVVVLSATFAFRSN